MAEPSSTRRWYRQFSLRGLLIALALVAIGFGIWSNASAQREWRALQAFDKSLRISLTRRNSLGGIEHLQGFQPSQAKSLFRGRAPAPWALWREDTVQSLFIESIEPQMSATALDPLVDIPSIERLELSVDEMDPRAIESLGRLKQLESLEWKGKFDESCLLALPRMPSVKRLELVPKEYGRLKTGLQALERLPNLSQLTLEPSDSSSKDVLTHAKLSPTPLALEISSGRYPGRCEFDLADMSAWSSVYYLQLSLLTPVGSIDFASMPQLQTIDLRQVKLSDADVNQLANLPKLERVTLYYTGVTTSQMARLLQNPHLKGIVVDEDGVAGKAFAGLRDHEQLEFLEVRARVVDEAFLESLRSSPAAKQCKVIQDYIFNTPLYDLATLTAKVEDALQKK